MTVGEKTDGVSSGIWAFFLFIIDNSTQFKFKAFRENLWPKNSFLCCNEVMGKFDKTLNHFSNTSIMSCSSDRN